MDNEQKKEILLKFKDFFRDTIAKNHIKNLRKLKSLKEFHNNPFLFVYLANFLSGRTDSTSLAKSLIYPRILGTSITTSFGQNFQKAASSMFKSVLGSTTSGIDLEFIDQVDGRKKYCQIKSGPDTLNKDDVETISNHFTGVRNIARTNNVVVAYDDLVVGVLYGEKNKLSGNYRRLMQNYPIFVGKDFWYRLTGDENFYVSLIETAGEAAKEVNAADLLDEVISQLADDIQEKVIEDELSKKQ